MSKLNKFQMVGFSHWKGLTKNNHLGAAFALAPQKATNMMGQLLAYHRGKTLETMLSAFPTKEECFFNELQENTAYTVKHGFANGVSTTVRFR